MWSDFPESTLSGGQLFSETLLSICQVVIPFQGVGYNYAQICVLSDVVDRLLFCREIYSCLSSDVVC